MFAVLPGNKTMGALSSIQWQVSKEADPPVSPQMKGEDSATVAVMQHLTDRGYVPFHPALAERFGHKAALFVGVALYWTRHKLRRQSWDNGWFYMSARQMMEATTLTRHEQDTVRSMLRNAGILQERLSNAIGHGPIQHYRIDLRKLATSLEVVDIPPDRISIEDAWSWFRQSINFFRPLADLAGSASGGLYLSWLLRQKQQAIQTWQQPGRQSVSPQRLFVDPSTVSKALSLSPKILRTTRQGLRRQGLIIEAGAWTSLNINAILACIQQQQDIKPLPGKPGSDRNAQRVPAEPARNTIQLRFGMFADPAPRPKLPKPANRNTLINRELPLHAPAVPAAGTRTDNFAWSMLRSAVAGNLQLLQRQKCCAGNASPAEVNDLALAQSGKPVDNFSSLSAQTGKRECLNRQIGVPKPANRGAQTGKPINNETISNNTTTTCTREDGAVDKSGCETEACRRRNLESPDSPSDSLDGLIYPDGLTSQLLPGIQEVLRQVPADQRQALLDELQGQMRIPNKTIHNPAGWLASLASKIRNGAALPLADSVAALRRQQETAKSPIATPKEAPVGGPPSAEVRRKIEELLRSHRPNGRQL
jgi:hypothetical protein